MSSDGTFYEDEFRDEQPDGQGVMTFPDGTRYEGGFRDGMFGNHFILMAEHDLAARPGSRRPVSTWGRS